MPDHKQTNARQDDTRKSVPGAIHCFDEDRTRPDTVQVLWSPSGLNTIDVATSERGVIRLLCIAARRHRLLEGLYSYAVMRNDETEKQSRKTLQSKSVEFVSLDTRFDKTSQ